MLKAIGMMVQALKKARFTPVLTPVFCGWYCTGGYLPQLKRPLLLQVIALVITYFY